MKQATITNLESITRNGSTYTVRYEWSENVEYGYGNPVYTSASTNGQLRASRNERHFHKTVKVQRREEVKQVEASEAAALVDAAKATGMIERLEKLADDKWVIRVKCS